MQSSTPLGLFRFVPHAGLVRLDLRQLLLAVALVIATAPEYHLFGVMPLAVGDVTLLLTRFPIRNRRFLPMSTIGWIIVAIIWIAIAFWPARVAGRKGHSFIGYFIFSLVFFPAALILAYMVQDRTATTGAY